jgi:hypothetical protein
MGVSSAFGVGIEDGRTVYVRHYPPYGVVAVAVPGRLGRWYGRANDWCERILKELHILDDARPAADVIDSMAENPPKATRNVILVVLLVAKLGRGIFLAAWKHLASLGSWR